MLTRQKIPGRRLTYVLRRPLFVAEHNTFDDLHTSKTTLLTGVLHLLKHRLVHLLIVAQILEAATLNAVLARDLLQGGLVWQHNGNGLVLGLIGVDANVADNRRGSVD